MAAFADRVLEYFDSGVGPIPGPYGVDNSGSNPVPVSEDIIVDENTTAGALSLPTGSSVTVGFNNAALIRDQPGNDLSVLEIGGETEQAEVYISSNYDPASPNENFVLLGTATAGSTGGNSGTTFDLASIGFTDTVEAVRIVGLDNGGNSPGFDVANVQALQPDIQIDDNLIALQPEWDSENSVLRYGFEVENANDFIAQNVEVELSFVDTRSVFLGLGSQNLILGEIPTDQTNYEIIGNEVWYELPIEDIPLDLTNQELEVEKILTQVDPVSLGEQEGRISEPDETDNTQEIDYFFVRTIPQIMRNRGEEWEVPANFQERWLNGEAATIEPPAEEAEDFENPAELISLDWILDDDVDTNGRAEEAFDQLTDTDYLFSENGRNSLTSRLDSVIEGLEDDPVGTIVDFGVEGTSAADLDAQQFQNRGVGTGRVIDIPFTDQDITLSTPVLDPLTGALGNFSFYATAIGNAEKVSDEEVEITVTDVGIYALDVFEFGGRQELGFWEAPDQVSQLPFIGGTRVTNSTYRDYSEQTGLGEDFIIVSNVEEVSLASAFNFSVMV